MDECELRAFPAEVRVPAVPPNLAFRQQGRGCHYSLIFIVQGDCQAMIDYVNLVPPIPKQVRIRVGPVAIKNRRIE